MRTPAALVVLSLVWIVAGVPASWAEAPDGGLAAAFELCRVMRRDASPDTQLRLSAKFGGPSLSPGEIKQAASEIGVPLVTTEGTFEEAIALNRPVVCFLREPREWVVMHGATGDSVQMARSGEVYVQPRAEVQARFAGLLLVPDNRSPESARARVEDPDVYMGKAGLGQRIEHVFRLESIGARPVTLVVPPQRCGACGDVEVKPPVVPVGSQASIKVVFTPRAFGLSGQVFWIETDDPLRARIPLTVRAAVETGFEIRPGQVRLRVHKGEAASSRIQVSLPPGTTIATVRCDVPDLRAVLGDLVAANSGTSVVVNLAARGAARPGVSSATVTLRPSAQDHAPITVPVSIVTIPELQCDPQSLFVGYLKPKQQVHAEVRLTAGAGRVFAVLDARASEISARVGKPEPVAGGYRLQVSVDAGTPGPLQGAVLIRTDVPGEELVSVPITGWVEQP